MENDSLKKKYRVGLVLSGGGARGFSHLGAVKALYEEGFQFDLIAGTSMGAIIGAMLADGYHPDELIKMLTKDRLKTFVKTHISKNSIMTMQDGMAFIAEILRAKNIEDLKIPFVAAATDIHQGKTHYFEKGNILEAITASASIPVVFAPVVIGGKQYIDGGVLNNLPARRIRERCDQIIGIHVNPQSLGLHHGEVKGVAQIAERSYHLCMLGNVLPDKSLCDIFIEHSNLDEYSAFDFVKMQEIVDIGYTNTKAALKERTLQSSQTV